MEQVQVASPDGKVALTIQPNAERLTFTVTLGSRIVIDPSTIVMNLDGYDLSSGVVLGNVKRHEINETYPWHGSHDTAVNQCDAARISLKNDLSLIDYVLEVRAFNNGVAFRHIIPGDDDVSRVPDEYTTFVIPTGSTVWYHDLGGHYEAAYKKNDISDVAPGQWAGPPVTFKLPGDAGYGSITEVNLANYSGMALEADGRRGLVTGLGHRQPLNYPYELRYGREQAKHLGKPASIHGTIKTPWRVIMVGHDLNTLVNSTIVPNLCPPPDPKYFPDGIEASWAKPGRAVWRYLDGGDRSFEGMKEFSRIAGQLGYEYHIIEGFWSRWSDDQIKEIVDFSREQGVRLLFWKHSNQLSTAEQREEFFTKLHSLGVVGVKIDFLDHEAKEVIDHYEALLKKAAENQMVVNFHGANKPTGRARTWPNEVVREAVRGMESSSLRERARHETIRPSKCSRRDLVADLYEALHKRGIRLMVYPPSGAPGSDHIAAEALQWQRGGYRNREFQLKWEQVIREWSVRWGDKVSGWWFDGCYWPNLMYRHPEIPNFESFAAAARAGYPDSVVAFNTGVYNRLRTGYSRGGIHAAFVYGGPGAIKPIGSEPELKRPFLGFNALSSFIDSKGIGGAQIFRNRLRLHEGPGAIDAEHIGGLTKGIHGSLLASTGPEAHSDPILEVFKGWPKSWDAAFTLRARGTFVVSSMQQNGKVLLVEIRSEAGSICRLVNPWPGSTVELHRQNHAAENLSGSLLAFPTVAGKTITRYPKGTRRSSKEIL